MGNSFGYRTDQARALDIDNLGVGIARAEASQNRHRLRRGSVVVAHQRVQVVSIGANHRNLFWRVLQREEAILILQEDDGLLRGAKGQFAVRLGVVFAWADTRVRYRSRRVKQAEPESRREQTS